MRLTLTTPPTSTPISLAEAKSFCRVLSNDDDALLGILINAATDYAQSVTGRALCESTYTVVVSSTSSPLILPKSPLIEIVSCKSGGIDIEWQLSWDIDVGIVEFEAESDVTIVFKAGYSETPSSLKAWMLNKVSTLFENREAIVIGQTMKEIPHSVIDCALDIYKVRYL